LVLDLQIKSNSSKIRTAITKSSMGVFKCQHSLVCLWQNICVPRYCVWIYCIQMGKNLNPPPFVGKKVVRKYSLFPMVWRHLSGKFIGSCSLRLRQMTVKSYHSVVWNKVYKVIPSLLLSRPPRGRHTSLPPNLPCPSKVQKMIYTGLNVVLLARETKNKN
jgi:hypothetical protein